MKARRGDNPAMEYVAITIVAALASLALVAVLVRRRHADEERGSSRAPRADVEPHRVRSAAEAEMEEHDIDDMLDAINRRRRQLGRRDVSEELADELMRGNWDN
jgi:hypothetical protein